MAGGLHNGDGRVPSVSRGPDSGGNHTAIQPALPEEVRTLRPDTDSPPHPLTHHPSLSRSCHVRLPQNIVAGFAFCARDVGYFQYAMFMTAATQTVWIR